MSLLTRLTRESAQLLVPQTRYVSKLPEYVTYNSRMPVFLTFDDGPHVNHTCRVLDQLNGLNAKATFFVIGENAKRYPGIIRRIISEGHSVGTHSWSHKSAANIPAADWIEDVQRARRDVEDILGQDCRLFRPPYGEMTPRVLVALLRTKLRIIHWSQDVRDFEFDFGEQLCQWFADNAPTPGTIVLMHDNQVLTANNLRGGCAFWQPDADFRAIPMTAECDKHAV